MTLCFCVCFVLVTTSTASATEDPTDSFDPWYYKARPVWLSLLTLVPFNEELLLRCQSAGILSKQQLDNIRLNSFDASRGQMTFSGMYESDPLVAVESKDKHGLLPTADWWGQHQNALTKSALDSYMSAHRCDHCNQLDPDVLLHKLRRGGRHSFYTFWHCLSAVFKDNLVIQALCSFMSNLVEERFGSEPAKGMNKMKMHAQMSPHKNHNQLEEKEYNLQQKW